MGDLLETEVGVEKESSSVEIELTRSGSHFDLHWRPRLGPHASSEVTAMEEIPASPAALHGPLMNSPELEKPSDTDLPSLNFVAPSSDTGMARWLSGWAEDPATGREDAANSLEDDAAALVRPPDGSHGTNIPRGDPPGGSGVSSPRYHPIVPHAPGRSRISSPAHTMDGSQSPKPVGEPAQAAPKPQPPQPPVSQNTELPAGWQACVTQDARKIPYW
jgi:hypothetical protein